MANLRDVVKSNQEYLSKDITWVAFWKEGRSWHSMHFYLELDDNVDEVMLPEQKKKLEEILAKDPKAIILNGYNNHLQYFNIAKLYHIICWHYKNNVDSKVKHFLEVTGVYNPQAEADKATKTDEPESIDEQQKPTFDKDSFLKSDFGHHLVKITTMCDTALKRHDSRTFNHCDGYLEATQAALLFFTGAEYHFSRDDDYCGFVSDDGDWLFKVR